MATYNFAREAYHFAAWTNFPVLFSNPAYVDANPMLPKRLWLLDVIDVDKLRVLIQDTAKTQRFLRSGGAKKSLEQTKQQSVIAHNAMVLRVSRLLLTMLTEGVGDAGVQACRAMDYNWTAEVARSDVAVYGCSVVVRLCSRPITMGESQVYLDTGLLQHFAIAHLRSLGLQITALTSA